MPDQLDITDKGGTMRLGVYPCALVPGTKAAQAYGAEVVIERHRHRFEFNNKYRERAGGGRAVLSAATRPTAGWSRSSSCATTRGSSASQFHPEFLSRPNRPHPLFRDFVRAAMGELVRGTADDRPPVSVSAGG